MPLRGSVGRRTAGTIRASGRSSARSRWCRSRMGRTRDRPGSRTTIGSSRPGSPRWMPSSARVGSRARRGWPCAATCRAARPPSPCDWPPARRRRARSWPTWTLPGVSIRSRRSLVGSASNGWSSSNRLRSRRRWRWPERWWRDGPWTCSSWTCRRPAVRAAPSGRPPTRVGPGETVGVPPRSRIASGVSRHSPVGRTSCSWSSSHRDCPARSRAPSPDRPAFASSSLDAPGSASAAMSSDSGPRW